MIFTRKQIGLILEDNLLILCEVVSDLQRFQEIRALNIVPIPEPVLQKGKIQDKKALQKILRDALDSAKPFPIRSREITFEVPEAFTFHHSLILPMNLTEEQMKEAMIFEAEKFLPFELSQVSWDIKTFPHEEKNRLVLFTAVPLEIIQEYYDVFTACGLLPLGFSLRAEDLITSLAKKTSKPTVLFDLQRKYTSVIFFRGKHLLSLDQLPIGEDDFQKVLQDSNESSFVDLQLNSLSLMKRFEQELKNLLSVYERLEPKVPYESIFLGNSLFQKIFEEYFLVHRDPRLGPLQTHPKHLLNLQTKDHNRLFYFSQYRGKSFFEKLIPGALGVSLAHFGTKEKDERPMNFLPPAVRSIALWKETSLWFYACASIILIFSIVWLMAFGFSWGSTVAQLRVAKSNLIAVDRQLSVKKSYGIEEKIRQANEELKVLNNLKQSKNPYADIIEAILKAVPQEVHFVALLYGMHQDKSLFELKGQSKMREVVIETHRVLKQLSFIKTVLFPPANLDKRDPLDFSILFNLKDEIQPSS